MPSSNTDREMLLSAALDGELSVQEQSEFDRLISLDPTFAGEFEELKALRNDLRLCFAEWRNQSLPVGATQRIVAAAIGTTDGLAPPADDSSLPRSAKAKWIIPALALAASVLIGFGLWTRDQIQGSSTPNLIAQVEPEKPFSSLSQTDLSQGTPSELAIASVEETGSRPKVMGITPMPNHSITARDVATGDNAPMIDKPGLPQTPDPALVAQADEPKAQREPLGVVLVLSIKLSQTGRDELALQAALRATDIRLGKDGIMGANVVSHLQTAKVIDTSIAAESPTSAKLYFIEASAKRIDRLFSIVMSDSRSFESVGLGLATEPPVLAAVGDLREIDATKIRQDDSPGFARGLVAADGKPVFVDPAYPLIPLNRETGGADLEQLNTGDDFPAQLLLFVQ